MDHLKWVSDIYDEYIVSLQKMQRCLDEELEKTEALRKAILNGCDGGEDQAITAILNKLEAVIRRLRNTEDRLIRLRGAVTKSIQMFSDAERRISNMGTELLYGAAMYQASSGTPVPMYRTYTSSFHTGEITPEWLQSLV